jgi:glutathione gamma-glutamylcysteinyltransferase
MYNMQEEVLRQVRGTRLFKLVRDLSDPCCSSSGSTSPKVSTLQEVVATACCQGAALLTGNPHVMDQNMSCCKMTCVKSVQSNAEVAIISGMVMISGGNEQGVDVLVPVSGKPAWCESDPGRCILKYPTSSDILAVLLLALPPSTWSAVWDKEVLDELQDLLSTASLPELLQLEVWLFLYLV